MWGGGITSPMGYGSAERDFLDEVFFCWRRSLFLEEVDFVGGGVFFWRKCFFCWRRSLFLEEVDFVGGGVFFWRKFFCWRRSLFLEEVDFVGGRPCRTWVQQIEDDTGLNANDAWRIAHDRKSWTALRPVAGQAFH